MSLPDASKLFDERYYATGLGLPYQRDAHWMGFFAGIAERIVAEIGPATALDAGCALGLLVEQLRARGVDAEGVDISEYAISSAHAAVRDYLRVGSVAEPFGRRYDLIICIEVLEHMPRAAAEAALANFCAHSDDVLFSSSPLDYKEATHFNVNPPEYWAERFARHGFFRDLDFDAAFITPWAARFRRRADPPQRVVHAYERRLWALAHENSDLRQLALEQRDQLNAAEARAATAQLQARAAERRLREQDERAARELRAQTAELRAYAARLEGELAAKNAHIAGLEALIRGLENGRVMRLLRTLGRRGVRQPRRRVDGEAGRPAATTGHATAAGPAPGHGGDAYGRWIAAHEPDAAALAAQRAAALRLTNRPLFSVIMPVYDPPVMALEAAIASLQAQTYDHWELCVVDAGSDPAVRAALEQAAASDPRVRLQVLGENLGIAANSNAALALARGAFVCLLDHDDTLAPDALFEVATLLNAAPDSDAIYFDEDKLSADGSQRHSPWFKPHALSPDLLLSTNYLMHGVFRRTLLRELGGFDPAADGAQDWDLALRVVERTPRIRHIARVLYHWRQVPGSAAREATAKPWAIAAQQQALAGHLARSGALGARVQVSAEGLVRVRWPTFGIRVSIIIPTRDKAELLRACVSSILRVTAYPDYELVLVDTGSVEPATAALYAELRAEPRVRMLQLSGPFNWGRANNYGARNATGERLLFLNNDTEVSDPDWLDELVGWAERPEVGVVGARLVRPDGTTQHAGIAMGIEGHGSHLFDGTSGAVYGPFGSSEWYRDLLAVTGACMLVRRDVFETLGGFDTVYQVGYSDIALCLAAVAHGYRVVYTPFARLLHHEGASRGFDLPPADVLRATMQMLPIIAAGDPYYSRHLSPVSRIPAIAEPGGEDALERLATILRHFGLVYYSGSAPLRVLAERAALAERDSAATEQPEAGAGSGPRLLLISHDLGLSGAPIILGELARALAARGYRVTLAAPADGPLRERLAAAGVSVRLVEHLLGDATVAYGTLAGHDLALINTIHGARAVHAAKAVGLPCVWWIHESAFGRRLAEERPEIAAALAAADALVFPTAATAERYADLLAGPAPSPIPYGVAAPPEPHTDPRLPRDGRLRAVLLGSVEPRKGQDILLRALAMLPEDLRARLEVELIGDVIDWPFYERLAPLAAAIPTARMLGPLEHSAALARMCAADALILPSRDEVLPLAMLEAMAAGKAIVAARVGGIPAALEDEQEALLFRAEDPRALAARLMQLLREPGLTAHLGAAARARWAREFTHEHFVERMEAVLRQTLAAREGAHR